MHVNASRIQTGRSVLLNLCGFFNSKSISLSVSLSHTNTHIHTLHQNIYSWYQSAQEPNQVLMRHMLLEYENLAIVCHPFISVRETFALDSSHINCLAVNSDSYQTSSAHKHSQDSKSLYWKELPKVKSQLKKEKCVTSASIINASIFFLAWWKLYLLEVHACALKSLLRNEIHCMEIPVLHKIMSLNWNNNLSKIYLLESLPSISSMYSSISARSEIIWGRGVLTQNLQTHLKSLYLFPQNVHGIHKIHN